MNELNRREFVKTIAVASAACALPGASEVNREKDWKVYMFNATHADIGWHNFPHIIREKITAFLDVVIELCDKTRNDEIPYVYTIEHAWIVENFEKTRPAAQFKKLIDCFKRGQIDVGALYASVHTDLCGHEELARSTLYAAQLRRRYGLKVDGAMLNDVSEGYTKGLAQILAKSGIQGIVFGPGVKAVSQGIAPVLPRIFFWGADDGSQVMVAWTPGLWTYAKGSAAGFRGQITLTEFAQFTDYPYDAIFRFAGGGDIAPADPGLINEVRQFRQECKTGKIKLATMSEFFSYVKKNFSEKIPVIRGDNPHSWADGTLSLARETGLHKRNQHTIITAEMMAALFLGKAYPKADIDDVYSKLLLYSDHTWGFDFDPDGRPGEMKKVKRADTQGHEIVVDIPSGEPFTSASKFFDDYRKHWQEKKDYVYQAESTIQKIQEQAYSAMCSRIAAEQAGVVVFNPLSFCRTDIVTLALDPGVAPFSLKDKRSGKMLVSQIEELENSQRVLTFVAENMPPIGYAIYEIVENNDTAGELPVNHSDTIENRFYRIKLDAKTGVVISIFDKELQKEIIDQGAEYGFNQYIHCDVNPFYNGSGGPEKAGIVYGDGQRYVPENIAPVDMVEGPVFSSLKVKAALNQGPAPAVLVRTLKLYHDVKRIDVINQVAKKESLFKEQIYFAFPFDVGCRPEFTLEQPYALLRWNKDILPGCWRGYCSMQNFILISGSDHAIVWSAMRAPVASIGGINSNRWNPDWHKSFIPENGHIYSYIMSNMWNCNYALFQSGEMVFPYHLTSSRAATTLEAARFGWGVAHPLLAKKIVPQKGRDSAAEFSAASVNVDNVLITSIKQAEDGNGVILRLYETGGQAETEFNLYFHSRIKSAHLTLLSEEDQSDLAVIGNETRCTIKNDEIISIRIIA
jgi:alpha-mannosidase